MSVMPSEKIDIAKLRSFKYGELRAFAKAMGIKLGNAKAEKYIGAILEKLKNTSEDSESDNEVTFVQINRSPAESLQHNSKNDAGPQASILQANSLADAQLCNFVPRARRIRRNTYDATPEINGVSTVSNTKASDTRENPPQSPTRKLRARVNNVTYTEVNSRGKKTKVSETVDPLVKRSKLPVRQNTKICSTPNFKAIHQRQFEQMDSIDVYMAKKKQRQQWHETLHHKAAKHIHTLRNKIPKLLEVGHLKPNNAVFKPTVISTTKMNTNFGTNTCQFNAHSKIASKELKSTPLYYTSNQSAKSPFRSGLPAKCTTSKTGQIENSHLVKRKLKYVPYTGPVTPLRLDTGISDFSRFNKSNLSSDKKCGKYKQHSLLQTPGQRRITLEGVRRNRRFNLQLKCRGIVAN